MTLYVLSILGKAASGISFSLCYQVIEMGRGLRGSQSLEEVTIHDGGQQGDWRQQGYSRQLQRLPEGHILPSLAQIITINQISSNIIISGQTNQPTRFKLTYTAHIDMRDTALFEFSRLLFFAALSVKSCPVANSINFRA